MPGQLEPAAGPRWALLGAFTAVGIGCALGILHLVGAHALIGKIASKWRLAHYQELFLGLLAVAILAYLGTRGRAAGWPEKISAGAALGLGSALAAMFLSITLSQGLASIARGFEDMGPAFPLLAIVMTFFPLLGWCYGILALVSAIFCEKYWNYRSGRDKG